MSRYSPSQEQTWAQLQERLRKVRERQSPSRGRGRRREDERRSRRSLAPNPLPRLDSSSQPDDHRWASPQLRGSHFPKVPPVTSQRAQSDDTLSLESYNSDPSLAEGPHQPPLSPPYFTNGGVRPSPITSPTWDQYTGRRRDPEQRDGLRRGKGKYYVRQRSADFVDDLQEAIHANHMEILGLNRDRYLDDGGGEEGPRLVEYDSVFGGRELVRVPVQRPQETRAYARMQDELFARTFLEVFLTSCLQDDMVLEVALDVIVQSREDQDIERQLSRPVLDVGAEILNEIVQESVREVAFIELRAAAVSFWNMAAEHPSLYKPAARDVLREVLNEQTTGLVPECISELVSEYFIQKDIVGDYSQICDEVVLELLPDIIIDAVYDESVNSVAEGFIHEEIVSMADSFMKETFAAGRQRLPLSPEERLHNKEEIKKLADDYVLDTMILEHLLADRLLPNFRVWNSEEYLDLFIDSVVLDRVLGAQLDIVNRRSDTEQCLPLKRFHEKICTNVAIDVLLGELTGHLDEDMAELDEYEVALDGHPPLDSLVPHLEDVQENDPP